MKKGMFAKILANRRDAHLHYAWLIQGLIDHLPYVDAEEINSDDYYLKCPQAHEFRHPIPEDAQKLLDQALEK